MLKLISYAISFFVLVFLLNAGITFGQNRDLNESINQAKNQSKKTEVQVSTGESGKETVRKSELLLTKEWLKDLKPNIRYKFLGDLLIKDGHVVSANVRYLKENLPGERVKEIIETFGRYSEFENEFMRTRKKKSQIFKLSDLFKDVPKQVKNSFLDNMIFKNGAIVSVRIKELEEIVSFKKLNNMMQSLTSSEPGEIKMKMNPGKALYGNGICYYAICRAGTGIETGCYPDEKNACEIWCHD